MVLVARYSVGGAQLLLLEVGGSLDHTGKVASVIPVLHELYKGLDSDVISGKYMGKNVSVIVLRVMPCNSRRYCRLSRKRMQ